MSALSKFLPVVLALLAAAPLPARAHSSEVPAPSSAIEITRAPRHLGKPFSLIDQHGKRVTDEDSAGKLRVMYFGHTYCGDACPLDLQNIALAVGLLGDRSREVAVIFITIDPARDTPARLADFLPRFDRNIVGLTGTAEEIGAVATSYGVAYEKIKATAPDAYDLSHPAVAFLMGRNGEFLDLLRPDTAPQELAKALQRRLGSISVSSSPRVGINR